MIFQGSDTIVKIAIFFKKLENKNQKNMFVKNFKNHKKIPIFTILYDPCDFCNDSLLM